MQLYKRKGIGILFHIFFWIIYVVLVLAIDILHNNYSDFYVKKVIFSLPIKVVLTYLVIFILIPRYIPGRKFWLFTSLTVVLLAFFSLLQAILYDSLIHKQVIDISDINLYKVGLSALEIFIVATLALFVMIPEVNFYLKRHHKLLEMDLKEMELKFLRSQIHPHFILNVLKDLKDLTSKKSPVATEMIMKLSALLEYMLYECRDKQIELQKEIKLIENFLSVEKMRFGDELDIELNITGEIENSEIAPFLLLPLVENAFKHGISEETTNRWIKMNLEISKEQLVFSVENNKNPNGNGDKKQGIGLINLEKRLDLLYGKSSTLKVQDLDKRYLAVLTICF